MHAMQIALAPAPSKPELNRLVVLCVYNELSALDARLRDEMQGTARRPMQNHSSTAEQVLEGTCMAFRQQIPP